MDAQSVFRGGVMLGWLLAAGGLAAQTANPDDQALKDAARAGRDLGNGLVTRAPNPNFEEGGDAGQGTIVINGRRLDVNDIAPGGTTAENMRMRALEGADEDTLRQAGADARRKLASDPSHASTVVRDVGQIEKDDERLAADPALWTETNRALLRQHPLAQDLGGCESRLEIIPEAGETVRIWNEKTCETITPLDECRREREVSITSEQRTVAHRTYNVQGSLTITVPMLANPAEGEKLLSANALLNWTGTVSDAAITVPPAAANQWTATITVTGTGTVTIDVEAMLEILRESFTYPDGEACLMASDGFCTARWTCTDDDVRTINGRVIDASFKDLLSEMYPAAGGHQPPDSMSPKICWKAEADYDCPMNIGAMECWTNPQGEQVCHENTTSNTVTNTCPQLEQNPMCQLLRRQCAQDASSASGHCYVLTSTYRCGEDIETEGIRAKTVSSCASTIRCMGQDCFSMEDKEEPVRSIAEGMAQMHLVQHLIADHKPLPARAKAASAVPTTEVMGGRPYECRKALGGLVDCCSQPTNTDGTKRWIEAYQVQQRQTQAKRTQELVSGEQTGSWDELSSGDVSLATLNKTITSRHENVTGGEPDYRITDEIAQQGDSLEVLNKALVEEAKEEHLLDSGWMCSAQEWELAQQKETGNCASIGSYCKRSVLGACIEKREVYCCFNSPLSRMAREQAAGQAGILAGAFGTPKAPRCDGVPMEVINGKLRTLVLDEWEARLHKAGVVPKAQDVIDRTNIDRLSGGSSLMGQRERKNLAVRTHERTAGINAVAVNANLADQAREQMDAEIGNQRTPGTISIEGAIMTVPAGRPAKVRVTRRGDLGAVVVGYSTADGTANAGLHYEQTAGALTWRDGESGTKTISIPVRMMMGRPPADFRLILSSASGGARIHPISTAEITIQPRQWRD